MHTARNERQQQMHRFRTAVEEQLGRSAGPRKTGGAGKENALETSGRENRLRPLCSCRITPPTLGGPNGSAPPICWPPPVPSALPPPPTNYLTQLERRRVG